VSKKTIVYLSLFILATALFAGWSIEFGFGPIVVTPNTQPVYPGYPYPYPYPYPTPTPTPAGGIRLGISSVDNNGNGVLVTQVLQGYPAYGQLFPGDIIRSVQIIQGQVMVYNNYVQAYNFYGYPQTPSGTWVYSSSQLQSMILSAPWNSSIILWIQRYGSPMMLVIQLVNANSPPIFYSINP